MRTTKRHMRRIGFLPAAFFIEAMPYSAMFSEL